MTFQNSPGNPYEMLEYRIPRKWAEAIVNLMTVESLASVTANWSPDECDAFVEIMTCEGKPVGQQQTFPRPNRPWEQNGNCIEGRPGEAGAKPD